MAGRRRRLPRSTSEIRWREPRKASRSLARWWRASTSLEACSRRIPASCSARGPASDRQALTEKDLQQCSARDLALMRNEIHARRAETHGPPLLLLHFEERKVGHGLMRQ